MSCKSCKEKTKLEELNNITKHFDKKLITVFAGISFFMFYGFINFSIDFFKFLKYVMGF